MADGSEASSGVKDLITRLRDDGVRAGEEEAERIVAEARERAASIVQKARAEAEALGATAMAEIEAERAAALESLHVAARDTVLQLKSGVTSAFERHLRRLVAAATSDETLIESLILVLAGRAAEEFLKDRQIRILVPRALLGLEEAPDQDNEIAQKAILGITREMLREGVDLVPDAGIRGGARVCLVGEDLEIDLTEHAISELMLKRLLPRFRSILEGVE